MKTIERSATGNYAKTVLMAAKAQFEFKTGKPEKPLKIGFENQKCVFIQFKTKGGIEDFYSNGCQSLQDAQSAMTKLIIFR